MKDTNKRLKDDNGRLQGVSLYIHVHILFREMFFSRISKVNHFTNSIFLRIFWHQIVSHILTQLYLLMIATSYFRDFGLSRKNHENEMIYSYIK